MSEELEALLDVGRLKSFIDSRIPGRGEQLSVTRLRGGSSNLMFRVERAGLVYVLRRPPRERYDPTSHNMEREVTLAKALCKTDVPHPRLVTYCDDPAVIGAPFTLMEFVDGFSPIGVFPEPFESDPALRRQIGFGMVEALATLARVDWRHIGLESFGRPDGFLERQVDRWLGQLARYKTR